MADVKSLYEILGEKRKKSVLKSMFVKNFNDAHANVRIEIETYDDTLLKALENFGNWYIFEQLEKKLVKPEVRGAIAYALGIESFKGALVTLYGTKHEEMYFMENGKNQYRATAEKAF